MFSWRIGGPGSLARDYGGSSQGRIAFLRDHLCRMSRIGCYNTEEHPDIVYAIDGVPGPEMPVASRLTVGQLVSLPSQAIGIGYYWNEVRVARRAASLCDLLVCNSELHLDACVDAWERRDALTEAAWAYEPRTPTTWAEEVIELCERAAEKAV